MKNILKLLAIGAVIGLFPACKNKENPEKAKETPEVTGITITSPSSGILNLKTGQSEKIEYELEPEDAIGTIEWESDDEDIASVKNGKVTGIAPGETTIRLSCGNISEEVDVVVEKLEVKSITLAGDMYAFCDTDALIPLKVEPEEAISCLDCEWDKSLLDVKYDNGAYYVKALSSDETASITFSSETTESKTISVTTYLQRMSIGMVKNNSYYEYYDDNEEVNYFDLYAKDRERSVFLALYPEEIPDPEKVSVSSSSQGVCTASVGEIQTSLPKNTLKIKILPGDKDGASDVSVSYDDELTGKVITKTLQISRVLPVFDEEDTALWVRWNNQPQWVMAYSPSTAKIGETIPIRVADYSNHAFYAKWAVGDSSILSITEAPDDEGYMKENTITALAIGTTTVTATDSKGNVLSYELEVKKKK